MEIWTDEGREGGRTGADKFNDLYICVVLLFMKWNQWSEVGYSVFSMG